MGSADSIRSAFDRLALKEMDSATLVFAIETAVDEMSLPTQTLRLAMEVAALAHIDQSRKNGIRSNRDPYIVHPLRNVLRLIRYGCTDVDILSATALHDTVEDQPSAVIRLLSGRPADDWDESELQRRASRLIAERFNSTIADIVAAVTNPVSTTPETSVPDYHSHVIDAISDPAVFLVKFSDFVDNAGSVKHLPDGQRTRLSAKYGPLVEHFRAAAVSLGAELNLPEHGLDAIARHLDDIEVGVGIRQPPAPAAARHGFATNTHE